MEKKNRLTESHGQQYIIYWTRSEGRLGCVGLGCRLVGRGVCHKWLGGSREGSGVLGWGMSRRGAVQADGSRT